MYGLLVIVFYLIGLGVYHKFQYYKKKKDVLIVGSVVDKHDMKSDAYLIAAVPLIILNIVISNFI